MRGQLPADGHRRHASERPRAHLRGGGDQQGGEVHQDAGPAAQLRPAEHHGLQDGREVGCLVFLLFLNWFGFSIFKVFIFYWFKVFIVVLIML